MDESDEPSLSWENLIYILDFLEHSSHRNISLLGGEPTLHPNFTDFTLYAMERGFHVNVFTSGILSDHRLEEMEKHLAARPRETLSFTCNLNHPSISPPGEMERVDRFLKSFHHLVSLGFNIYRKDFEIGFLLQKILEFNLNRNVRIGLTHPIPRERNSYVAVMDMTEMARSFMEHLPLFERLNVTPSFDCGMPMCLFDDQELGQLYRASRNRLAFGCGPAIDIGPDMTVWSCFPLSGLEKRSIYDFNSLQEVHDFYRSNLDRIRLETGGIFEDCDDCRHRSNHLCLGGCLAHFAEHYITGDEHSS